MFRTAALAGILVASVAPACDLCTRSGNTLPMRQEAASAKVVAYGTLQNPRLNAAGAQGGIGGGSTDFAIEAVIKDHPFLAGKKQVTIARFMPVDPQKPPHYLLFCDVFNDKLDAYRGTPVKSDAVLTYLRGTQTLAPDDRIGILKHAFRYLDSADADISSDAYLEFARAGNADVATVAPQLDTARLRKIVLDPQTLPERLGLFAYLLAASGHKEDETTLLTLLKQPRERIGPTLSGVLAGLVTLAPDTGWREATKLATEPGRPFGDRLSVLKMVEFIHATRWTGNRDKALACVGVVLDQPDVADIAIENLRMWHEWDMTPRILAQYSKPTHASPLMRRGILRYALQCPKPEAAKFVADARKADAELVKDVEESLEFEKPLKP